MARPAQARKSIPHCRLRGRGSHAPDGIADIVGDEQAAAPVDRDADRTSECLAFCVDETSKDIHRLSRRTPGGERHEDDLMPLCGLRFHDPCCPTNAPFLYRSGSDVPWENVSPSEAVWLPSA